MPLYREGIPHLGTGAGYGTDRIIRAMDVQSRRIISNSVRLIDATASFEANFVAGSTGFQFVGDGTAEVNDLLARGSIRTGDSGEYMEFDGADHTMYFYSGETNETAPAKIDASIHSASSGQLRIVGPVFTTAGGYIELVTTTTKSTLTLGATEIGINGGDWAVVGATGVGTFAELETTAHVQAATHVEAGNGLFYSDASSLGLRFTSGEGSDYALYALPNSYTQLRYNNLVRLQTSSGGLTVTGDINLGNVAWSYDITGYTMVAYNDTGAALYYGNTMKARVTSGGMVVVGTIAADDADAEVKAFVIDHPTKPGWQLRHISVESPGADVAYRGEVDVAKDETTIVSLPEYVNGLCDLDDGQVFFSTDQEAAVWGALSADRVLITADRACRVSWHVILRRVASLTPERTWVERPKELQDD